tara:strand:- start:51 stop:719 length:669 start_codon:yes stop_codon:yes gene_type:complete
MKVTDIIVNNIEYDVLEISTIKQSMVNPSIRTNRDNNSFKKLKHNIKINGLISPVVVDKDHNLIDGHRRLNALRDLGHTLIPVNINKSVDPKKYAKTFTASHIDTMKINAAQQTEMYLNGVRDIAPRVLNCIKVLERVGGRQLIKNIAEQEKSPETFVAGMNMYCKHIKNSSLKTQRTVMYYMLNVDSAYALKSAIFACTDAETIKDFVENRKKINYNWMKK